MGYVWLTANALGAITNTTGGEEMTKKRTKTDNFNIMLWAMISDCGNAKKYQEFKYALAKAGDVLNKVMERKK